MRLLHLFIVGLAFGLAALLGTACDTSDPIVDDAPIVETQQVALSFVTFDLETACGTAAGIRVVISQGDDVYECTTHWAPALVSEPYTSEGDVGVHHVADCYFLLEAGTYSVDTVEVIGLDEEPLACCDAEYPTEVDVSSGATSEFAAELSCELEGPGGLDIYGWLNRPPIITKMSIHPSKFGAPCVPRFFVVEAFDKELDEIAYTWEVVATPITKPTYYALFPHGRWAAFVGFTPGEYTIMVTVTDVPHGLSTSLTFPVHVTEPVGFGPMAAGTHSECTAVEPTPPADLM